MPTCGHVICPALCERYGDGGVVEVCFLGTGAADGVPQAFCACATCSAARQTGGRAVRARASLLVNDDLLIDLGPDVPTSAARCGASLAGVSTLLVTHAHQDHFAPAILLERRSEATPLRPAFLTVYGEAAAVRAVREWGPHLDDLALAAVEAAPFGRWRAGRYAVRAYPAAHADALSPQPLLWEVADGRHALLYATDTGPLPEATWEALRFRERPFDLVVLDETMGHAAHAPTAHLNLHSFAQQASRLRAEGVLGPASRLIATHVSHHNPPPDALDALLADSGASAAYDGLRLHLT